MKKIFTLFFVFITVISYSQVYWAYNINFEDISQLFRLEIDTISNPNNIWQIGSPQKTTLSNAYSSPNVIITDTVNSYPINDTSVFIIKHIACFGLFVGGYVDLVGYYYVNSDTLKDYGKIEFSHDNGTSWVDLLNDSILIDTINNHYWYWSNLDKPTLTGNSNGWNGFFVNIGKLGGFYKVQIGDTVLYRFSFISDSIQTNKDGLMFDNLQFDDFYEGIEEISCKFIKSECFPNPAKDVLTIKFENEENSSFELFVFDITGKQIYNQTNMKSNQLSFSVADFKKAIYIYKLVNQKGITIQKFIKN